MNKDTIPEAETLKLLTDICYGQKTGVLATSGDDGPYQSLVAFTALPGLREFVFATDRNTTKFRNIKKSHRVSLCIDNRTVNSGDFKNIIVVTALGDAYEIDGAFDSGPGKEYMDCHPMLGEKFFNESSALVGIIMKKYIIVSDFNDVRIYYPPHEAVK